MSEMTVMHENIVSNLSIVDNRLQKVTNDLVAARTQLNAILDTYVNEGKVEMKAFVSAKNAVQLAEALIGRLKENRAIAERQLWVSDLEEARAAYKITLEKAAQIRVKLEQALKDKSNYLRASSNGSVKDNNPETLVNLDIILTDIRIQAELADRNRRIAGKVLRETEDGYNNVAAGLGLELLELSMDSLRYY